VAALPFPQTRTGIEVMILEMECSFEYLLRGSEFIKVEALLKQNLHHGCWEVSVHIHCSQEAKRHFKWCWVVSGRSRTEFHLQPKPHNLSMSFLLSKSLKRGRDTSHMKRGALLIDLTGFDKRSFHMDVGLFLFCAKNRPLKISEIESWNSN
jgi:hypothetical protein